MPIEIFRDNVTSPFDLSMDNVERSYLGIGDDNVNQVTGDDYRHCTEIFDSSIARLREIDSELVEPIAKSRCYWLNPVNILSRVYHAVKRCWYRAEVSDLQGKVAFISERVSPAAQESARLAAELANRELVVREEAHPSAPVMVHRGDLVERRVTMLQSDLFGFDWRLPVASLVEELYRVRVSQGDHSFVTTAKVTYQHVKPVWVDSSALVSRGFEGRIVSGSMRVDIQCPGKRELDIVQRLLREASLPRTEIRLSSSDMMHSFMFRPFSIGLACFLQSRKEEEERAESSSSVSLYPGNLLAFAGLRSMMLGGLKQPQFRALVGVSRPLVPGKLSLMPLAGVPTTTMPRLAGLNLASELGKFPVMPLADMPTTTMPRLLAPERLSVRPFAGLPSTTMMPRPLVPGKLSVRPFAGLPNTTMMSGLAPELRQFSGMPLASWPKIPQFEGSIRAYSPASQSQPQPWQGITRAVKGAFSSLFGGPKA